MALHSFLICHLFISRKTSLPCKIKKNRKAEVKDRRNEGKVRPLTGVKTGRTGPCTSIFK